MEPATQQTPTSEAPPPAAKIRYPPGYHFVPTDSELILEYLKKKVDNEPIPISDIKDTYLKHNSPRALTESFPKIGDNEWYFFTPRDRKYPNGTRPDRAADTGYWKATGADKQVVFEGRVIGFRKALVFYQGKPQQGVKTGWIMHEFRLNQSPRNKRNPRDMRLDDWVLCRIYEKPLKSSSTRNSNCRRNTNRKDRVRVRADDEIKMNPLEDVREDDEITVASHQENVVDNDHECHNALPPLINHHHAVNYSYQNINPVPVQEEHYHHHHHQEPAVVNTAAAAAGAGDWFHHQDLQQPYGDGDDLIVFDVNGVDQLEINALIGNNNIYLNEQEQQGFGFNGGGFDPTTKVAAASSWISNENCFISSSNMKQLQSSSWNNNNEAAADFVSSFLPSNTNNINYHSNFGDPIYSHIGVENVEEDKKRSDHHHHHPIYKQDNKRSKLY